MIATSNCGLKTYHHFGKPDQQFYVKGLADALPSFVIISMRTVRVL